MKIAIALFLFYAGMIGFSSYGMYTLLRIAVCTVSAIVVFRYYQEKQQFFTWIFIIIAVLFNPIIKIHLHREAWEIIDIIIAIIFLISAYFDWQKQKKSPPRSDA